MTTKTPRPEVGRVIVEDERIHLIPGRYDLAWSDRYGASSLPVSLMVDATELDYPTKVVVQCNDDGATVISLEQ